jgi:hypothetical protein
MSALEHRVFYPSTQERGTETLEQTVCDRAGKHGSVQAIRVDPQELAAH